MKTIRSRGGKGIRADPLANRPFLRSAAFSDFEFSFLFAVIICFQTVFLGTQKNFFNYFSIFSHTFAIFVAIK